METKKYSQLNILKSFAILSVLILHSLTNILQDKIFSFFHINQCISIFIILLGLNSGLSFKVKKYQKLKEFYSKRYFKRKLIRIILPYSIIYIFTLIISILFYELKFNDSLLYGYTFIGGSGNYFIFLLFQFILIFPLMVYCYQKNPKLTIIFCFFINIIFEINSYFIAIRIIEIFHNRLIFNRFGCLIIGLWISDKYNQQKLTYFLIKNKLIFIGFLISISYFILYYSKLPFLQFYRFKSTSILGISYTIIFIIITLRFLPNQSLNKVYRFFEYIGKSSYHIFLIQMIFFVILLKISPEIQTNKYIIILLFLSFVFCIILGILFYEINKKLNKCFFNQ